MTITAPRLLTPQEVTGGRRLLTEQEAARMLGICPRKMHDIGKSGEIPRVMIGRSVRYDPDDVWDYAGRNKTKPAT